MHTTPTKSTDNITNRQTYASIAEMDINSLYLEEKNPSSTGFAISISHYFPELAIIFKTMLLNAIDGRLLKLTVEFDDLTAFTTLDYSKRLETTGERGQGNDC